MSKHLTEAKEAALVALREYVDTNPYVWEWNWLTTAEMERIQKRQAAWEKVQATLEALKALEGVQ